MKSYKHKYKNEKKKKKANDREISVERLAQLMVMEHMTFTEVSWYANQMGYRIVIKVDKSYSE